jgi:hypothetical protein
MNDRTVRIAFTFRGGPQDGQRFAGQNQEWAIIHEALEANLPPSILHERRTTVRTTGGALIFPDMFCGEVFDKYAVDGVCELDVFASPLAVKETPWRNVGIDHVVLSVKDRKAATDFFVRGLQMQIMRDDPHMTVLTTGNNALFFFDAEPGKPLTDGIPSRIHHIGFVVDDLEAAFTHLKQSFPQFTSDFTLLERIERWSMYGQLMLGDITFMIQLSEIKPEFRGFDAPEQFTDLMYDYASRRYGVRLTPSQQTENSNEQMGTARQDQ